MALKNVNADVSMTKLILPNSAVKNFVKLTQAQYDTLVANNEVDEDTFYFIVEE